MPYVPGLSGAAREGAGAAGGAGAGSPHPESCNNLFLSQKEAPPSAAARHDVLVLFCVRGPEGAEVRDAPARRQAGTQAERGRQRGGRGGSDPGANARGCGAGTGQEPVPRPPGAVLSERVFGASPSVVAAVMARAGGRRGREPWCMRAGRRQVLAVLWMVLLVWQL